MRVAIVLCLVMAAFGCNRSTEAKAKKTQPEPPLVLGSEDVAGVTRGAVLTGALISGQLRAQDSATVRAQLAGHVATLDLKVGQRVEKGQLLASIRAISERAAVGSAQAAVETAKTDLAVARRDRERTAQLVKAGALAQRDLEQADAAVASAEARVSQAAAQLESAREALREATIRAPIQGVISSVPANQGDIVSVGAELFTIIDPSTMELQASVPTDAIGEVRIGTPVLFRVQGYGEQRFRGAIRRISPAADPTTRQVDVFASIPNSNRTLIAGLYAEGRVATGNLETLLVPAEAVQDSGGQNTVLVVRDRQIQRQEVTLGARDERTGRWQVINGLQEGDVVLTGPARQLRAGAPVELRGEAGQAAR